MLKSLSVKLLRTLRGFLLDIWNNSSNFARRIMGFDYYNTEIQLLKGASSSLVFRSKSKSFEDKIKQNPLKHRFRGFFICCRSVSFRHRGAPTRHSPNLEVSLRISTVKIRDTYSEMKGHFDNFSAFHKLFRLAVAYTLIKTVR